MFWTISYHHSKQNQKISVVSEMLESAGAPLTKSCEINDKNFDTLYLEVSDPLHTNSIARLCTQPYHNPVRKSLLFLSWLVGQLEFKDSCLF